MTRKQTTTPFGDVFRRAAERIDAGLETFSCLAVDHEDSNLFYGARTKYVRLLAPVRKNRFVYLLVMDFEAGRTAVAARQHRVLALLLAAAMADTGDLDES